jgi:hypothetical protein
VWHLEDIEHGLRADPLNAIVPFLTLEPLKAQVPGVPSQLSSLLARLLKGGDKRHFWFPILPNRLDER